MILRKKKVSWSIVACRYCDGVPDATVCPTCQMYYGEDKEGRKV